MHLQIYDESPLMNFLIIVLMLDYLFELVILALGSPWQIWKIVDEGKMVVVRELKYRQSKQLPCLQWEFGSSKQKENMIIELSSLQIVMTNDKSMFSV